MSGQRCGQCASDEVRVFSPTPCSSATHARLAFRMLTYHMMRVRQSRSMHLKARRDGRRATRRPVTRRGGRLLTRRPATRRGGRQVAKATSPHARPVTTRRPVTTKGRRRQGRRRQGRRRQGRRTRPMRDGDEAAVRRQHGRRLRLSIYLPINLSINQSIHRSIYPSIHLSINLVCLCLCLSCSCLLAEGALSELRAALAPVVRDMLL